MKRVFIIALVFAMTATCASCGIGGRKGAELQTSKLKAVSELAAIECYFHNVEKFTEEDAERFLWIKKDKHFWVEYDVVAKLGIDASLVDMKVKKSQVTITLP